MTVCDFCSHLNAAGRNRCEQCGAELPVDPRHTEQAAARQALTGLDAEIASRLEREGKIAAIKHYREVTGKGLKESKEAVEALARRVGIDAQGRGCAGAVLVLMLLVAALGGWVATGGLELP